MKKLLKSCVAYYALAVIAMILFFVVQLFRSDVTEQLDVRGWIFYLTSCVSHAACLGIIPLLGSLIPTAFGKSKIGRWIGGVLLTVLLYFLWLDSNVYAIYRFHINGFVMNMVLGPGAGEIFAFSPMVYAKEVGAVVVISLGAYGAWRVVDWMISRKGKCYGLPLLLSIVLCTLLAHGIHMVSAFQCDFGVMTSARILPYYYPMTARGLCRSLGIKEGESRELTTGTSVNYPKHSLEVVQPDSLPNIVMILVDSWNKRAFTPECMPNACRFADENTEFTNHFSASNGTRSAVFSLFFGLSCYYWEDFEAARVKPVFVRRLLDLDYDCKAYPSATLQNPDFARVIFSEVPDLTVSTEGETAILRDSQLTCNFLRDLPALQKAERPYFAFLFYDLPHSYRVPAEKNTHFTPAWEYADFASLNNDTDPTPFFNLYRNCCYEADLLIGQVLDSLKNVGALDNTIVILTADHAQEFNENHRNFWGHNSNFSKWQLEVPLMVHWPKGLKTEMPKGEKFTHRTTHYDLIPTLMNELGVANSSKDYSTGTLLTDTDDRDEELVGSHLNFAFVGRNDTIFEQLPGGGFQVFTADMTPLKDYHVSSAQFDRWMKQLNSFYR